MVMVVTTFNLVLPSAQQLTPSRCSPLGGCCSIYLDPNYFNDKRCSASPLLAPAPCVATNENTPLGRLVEALGLDTSNIPTFGGLRGEGIFSSVRDQVWLGMYDQVWLGMYDQVWLGMYPGQRCVCFTCLQSGQEGCACLDITHCMLCVPCAALPRLMTALLSTRF